MAFIPTPEEKKARMQHLVREEAREDEIKRVLSQEAVEELQASVEEFSRRYNPIRDALKDYSEMQKMGKLDISKISADQLEEFLSDLEDLERYSKGHMTSVAEKHNIKEREVQTAGGLKKISFTLDSIDQNIKKMRDYIHSLQSQIQK